MNLPLNPAAGGLKLRFAEKKHGYCVFFRREVSIFSPAAAGSGGWASLHGGCPRKILLGLLSPTAF